MNTDIPKAKVFTFSRHNRGTQGPIFRRVEFQTVSSRELDWVIGAAESTGNRGVLLNGQHWVMKTPNSFTQTLRLGIKK
jgi:hypothetical protein